MLRSISLQGELWMKDAQGVRYRSFHSPSQSASLSKNWDANGLFQAYGFLGFQGVWSLPLGSMIPGLLKGNMSLITINRAGIQKATTALTSFKVHTHPVCAQKELNRSGKNQIFPSGWSCPERRMMAYAGAGRPLTVHLCLCAGWGDGIFRDELLLSGASWFHVSTTSDFGLKL